MLKALARYILRKDAEKTVPTPKAASVSPEDLHKEIQRLEQKIEWELGEWYDKFSALHARAEKRAQRELKKQPNGNGNPVVGEQPEVRKSVVLANRRAWSP